MSTAENVFLVSFGTSILMNMGRLSSEMAIFGMTLVVFSMCTSLFLSTGLKSTRSKMLFAVTVISFTLAVIQLAGRISFNARQVKLLLQKDVDTLSNASRKARSIPILFPSDLVQLWAGDLCPIISDAVVLWRASVLYPRNPLILALPIALILATTGTTLAFLGSISTYSRYQRFLQGGYGFLLDSSFALSFGTNFVSTALISYRFWEHRQIVRTALGRSPTHLSRVEKVLGLLIESGVAYCVYQLILFVLSFLPDPIASAHGGAVQYTRAVFAAAYVQLSALYPMLIILLVRLQQTESSGVSVSRALSDLAYNGNTHDDVEMSRSRADQRRTRPSRSVAFTSVSLAPLNESDSDQKTGDRSTST